MYRVHHRAHRGGDGAPMGVGLVHDAPDDPRGEQADGHGHEDDGLEGRGPADALGQHGEDQPEEGDEEREDDHPDGVVAYGHQEGRGPEEGSVVAQPDVLAGVAAVEAAHDRGHGRVDDDGAQEHGGRAHEQRGHQVASQAATRWAAGAWSLMSNTTLSPASMRALAALRATGLG